jgi:hypothetical protein
LLVAFSVYIRVEALRSCITAVLWFLLDVWLGMGIYVAVGATRLELWLVTVDYGGRYVLIAMGMGVGAWSAVDILVGGGSSGHWLPL